MLNAFLALGFVATGVALYLVLAPKVSRALERRRDSEAYNWGWTEGYDVGIGNAKIDHAQIKREAHHEGYSAGWDAAIESLSQGAVTPAKPKRSRAKKIRKAEP